MDYEEIERIRRFVDGRAEVLDGAEEIPSKQNSLGMGRQLQCQHQLHVGVFIVFFININFVMLGCFVSNWSDVSGVILSSIG